MILALSLLLERQALGFVLAAAAVCAVSGWLVAHLSRRLDQASPGDSLGWLAGTAVIAGTGVWTTHFIAMLGYRTDLAVGFDGTMTLVSALAAVALVGVPVALSGLFRRRAWRAAAGAVAGVGIGAMHLIGMGAIQGCAQLRSPGADSAACLIGASFMAAAFGLFSRPHRPARTTVLFVLAVCGTHFVSLAGTALDGAPVSRMAARAHVALSLLTAGGAAIILLAACAALLAARRFEAKDEAHASALATALQNMSNGILTVSASETVQIYNRRLLALLRLNEPDVTAGLALGDFLARVGRANGWDDARVARVLDNHRVWMTAETETRIEHVFDDGRILLIVCQPVADGAVLTYEDVTKVREAQREVAHLAYHDPLTGLANRRSMQRRLEADFAEGQHFNLLLVDLDRFKFVNDTYGHGVGDRLLRQVAERLVGVAGDAVFVARLGGDELALLVHGSSDLARRVADRVMAEIARPFEFDDFTVSIGCSIGLCDTADAAGPEPLMSQADLALYEAKRHGRGRTIPYRPGMIEAVTERNRLESDLRGALAAGQFHLAYQPIQSLGSDAIIGYEALIRWQHPSRGLVSPVDFIPLAEETGLIVPIGRWVLEQACREAVQWPPHRHVAVNVSAVQFRSPALLAHVAEALAASGLPARRLEIELTETALVEDGRQIAHTLRALRALGVTIAMDDFGTGYSSLAHLRDLPIDRIKIDRSFVATAEADIHSLAVIRAITQMGRDMGIETLAEGIETSAQLELIRGLGCGAVQGYLIGRPARPASTAPAPEVQRVA